MGNPGEERLQAERCVNELENIAKMLDMAATEHSVHMVSANVPEMIINILNKLSNLSSRKSAERLLAVGEFRLLCCLAYSVSLTFGIHLLFRCIIMELGDNSR